MNFKSPVNTNPIQVPDDNLNIDQPALIGADKQARALIHQRWEYSPVRLASYQKEIVSAGQNRKPVEYRGQLKVVEQSTRPNAIWQAK